MPFHHYKIETKSKWEGSGREVFAFLNWVRFKQQASHRCAKGVETMSSTETQNPLTTRWCDQIERQSETKQMNN